MSKSELILSTLLVNVKVMEQYREHLKYVCVCVYSSSCNDVPQVAQRYRTIAAHTRRCASVLVFVVFCVHMYHTCDISRFWRELPIWSLSSRSHSRETKPPDERYFQCHFSRTVFLSEHFIVYGSIYLANNCLQLKSV